MSDVDSVKDYITVNSASSLPGVVTTIPLSLSRRFPTRYPLHFFLRLGRRVLRSYPHIGRYTLVMLTLYTLRELLCRSGCPETSGISVHYDHPVSIAPGGWVVPSVHPEQGPGPRLVPLLPTRQSVSESYKSFQTPVPDRAETHPTCAILGRPGGSLPSGSTTSTCTTDSGCLRPL